MSLTQTETRFHTSVFALPAQLPWFYITHFFKIIHIKKGTTTIKNMFHRYSVSSLSGECKIWRDVSHACTHLFRQCSSLNGVKLHAGTLPKLSLNLLRHTSHERFHWYCTHANKQGAVPWKKQQQQKTRVKSTFYSS